MDNHKKLIETILIGYHRLLKNELLKYNPYKFSEEFLRYYFYKSLIKNGYLNEEVSYEANFNKNNIDKVDLQFRNSFLEIKFHRELENGNKRPFPYGLGKVLSDFFKLNNAPSKANIQKYFLYIFDDRYLKYIKKNGEKNGFDFLLNSEGCISLSQIRKMCNNTIKKELRTYEEEEILNFKLLFSDRIKFNEQFILTKDNKHLNIYFYEIK